MEMLQNIRFTSKASLKQQCLFIANANAEEAKKLYEFLIDGMEDLPATDPIPQTWQDSTAETVNGIMGWIKENQDVLSSGINYLRGLFQKAPVIPDSPTTPLPKIN